LSAGKAALNTTERVMNLTALEYFTIIAELGSFSRAAARRNVGQPVLSRQIRLLETELGVELFHRTGRGVSLTEAGRRFETHCKSLLAAMRNARAELDLLKAEPGGGVTIAMPPSIGWLLTAPLVRSCYREAPQISLHVVEGFSGHVLDWLASGRIDIGIVYNAAHRAHLETEQLLDEELVVLGPANDPSGLGASPIRAADLARVPLLLPAEPHGLRILIDGFAQRIGVTLNVRSELDAMPSTLQLVESGDGYTILSQGAGQHLISAGRIRFWRITNPAIRRQLMLTTSTQRPITPSIRLVIQMIRRHVAVMQPGDEASRDLGHTERRNLISKG
jgi:LysR family nitrogen assimilation transcriptional regulator